MHHSRTSTRTQHRIHHSTQHHFRQIQILQIHATTTRIIRNILQQNPRGWSKFKDLEEHLVKDLFISNMTNTSIQMDLLSDVRTPQQVLSFAINRERGQANQQEILKTHSSNTNWSKVS